ADRRVASWVRRRDLEEITQLAPSMSIAEHPSGETAAVGSDCRRGRSGRLRSVSTSYHDASGPVLGKTALWLSIAWPAPRWTFRGCGWNWACRETSRPRRSPARRPRRRRCGFLTLTGPTWNWLPSTRQAAWISTRPCTSPPATTVIGSVTPSPTLRHSFPRHPCWTRSFRCGARRFTSQTPGYLYTPLCSAKE